MAHLLSCRLLDEACTADDLTTVTERQRNASASGRQLCEGHERRKNLVTHIKIYNSGYSTEIVNEQCNTGDPLETSGGLYRGPPYMLIYTGMDITCLHTSSWEFICDGIRVSTLRRT